MSKKKLLVHRIICELGQRRVDAAEERLSQSRSRTAAARSALEATQVALQTAQAEVASRRHSIVTSTSRGFRAEELIVLTQLVTAAEESSRSASSECTKAEEGLERTVGEEKAAVRHLRRAMERLDRARVRREAAMAELDARVQAEEEDESEESYAARLSVKQRSAAAQRRT